MCRNKKSSVAKTDRLSSARRVLCSLDTQRALWNNDHTTLPEGLFQGLTAMTDL